MIHPAPLAHCCLAVRGDLIAGFSLVWIAKVYMSLFGRLRMWKSRKSGSMSPRQWHGMARSRMSVRMATAIIQDAAHTTPAMSRNMAEQLAGAPRSPRSLVPIQLKLQVDVRCTSAPQ